MSRFDEMRVNGGHTDRPGAWGKLAEPCPATLTPEQHRIALLEEALANALGFLDTPIARRKLGLDPNAVWLAQARKLVKEIRA